uniref:Retrotransposon gag domain-containing protein n=1 Tax=Oryzias melastigma TaxID=30732 RepID=A0A3B3D3S2_ORYME
MSFLGKIDEFMPDSEAWSAYVERVELFFEANDVSENKRVPVLLSAVGAARHGLLQNLVQPAVPKEKSFKEIVDILRSHFEPKPLVKAERFRFNQCCQKQRETVLEFTASLKQSAVHCEFGAGLGDALRDGFVSGKRKLLSEDRLSFTRQLKKMEDHNGGVHKMQVKAPHKGQDGCYRCKGKRKSHS